MPLSHAFDVIEWTTLKWIIEVGAIFGMCAWYIQLLHIIWRYRALNEPYGVITMDKRLLCRYVLKCHIKKKKKTRKQK